MVFLGMLFIGVIIKCWSDLHPLTISHEFKRLLFFLKFIESFFYLLAPQAVVNPPFNQAESP